MHRRGAVEPIDLVDVAAGVRGKDIKVAGGEEGTDQAYQQHLKHWHGSKQEQRQKLHFFVLLFLASLSIAASKNQSFSVTISKASESDLQFKGRLFRWTEE